MENEKKNEVVEVVETKEEVKVIENPQEGSNSVPNEVVEKKEVVGTVLPKEVQEALEKTEVDGSKKEVKAKMPKLFVTEDEEIDVEVDVIFNATTGDIISVVVAEVELDIEKLKTVFGHNRYCLTFSRPTYDKLNRYRQRAMEYDQITKSNTINQLKLRDFFIVYHLKKWNIKDDNGKKIELKFEPNGSLTDETIDVVYGLHPSIIDVVITSFERKMLLIG